LAGTRREPGGEGRLGEGHWGPSGFREPDRFGGGFYFCRKTDSASFTFPPVIQIRFRFKNIKKNGCRCDLSVRWAGKWCPAWFLGQPPRSRERFKRRKEKIFLRGGRIIVFALKQKHLFGFAVQGSGSLGGFSFSPNRFRAEGNPPAQGQRGGGTSAEKTPPRNCFQSARHSGGFNAGTPRAPCLTPGLQ